MIWTTRRKFWRHLAVDVARYIPERIADSVTDGAGERFITRALVAIALVCLLLAAAAQLHLVSR